MFGSYHLITEHLSPDRVAQIDWEDRANQSLPFEWIDGPTFYYQNNALVAYGSCQRATDPKLRGGEYCPWKDLDVTSWELSDDTFTAGAYRALDEF